MLKQFVCPQFILKVGLWNYKISHPSFLCCLPWFSFLSRRFLLYLSSFSSENVWANLKYIALSPETTIDTM